MRSGVAGSNLSGKDGLMAVDQLSKSAASPESSTLNTMRHASGLVVLSDSEPTPQTHSYMIWFDKYFP